jgi:hypothetical protein
MLSKSVVLIFMTQKFSKQLLSDLTRSSVSSKIVHCMKRVWQYHYKTLKYKGQASTVSIATRLQTQWSGVQVLAGVTDCSLLEKWSPTSLLFNWYQDSLPGAEYLHLLLRLRMSGATPALMTWTHDTFAKQVVIIIHGQPQPEKKHQLKKNPF